MFLLIAKDAARATDEFSEVCEDTPYWLTVWDTEWKYEVRVVPTNNLLISYFIVLIINLAQLLFFFKNPLVMMTYTKLVIE